MTMTPLPRRDFMQGAALAAGTAIAVGAGPTEASAQTQSAANTGKTMSYAIKPMSFDPQKITGMSEKLLISHYENNYSGAVKRLNQIAEQLAGLDFDKTPGYVVNGLKREELIATNSMILHEVYFDGLGPESQPGSDISAALDRDFGGFTRWRSEFANTGKALGGGSGWVILAYSPHDKRLVNQWAADHTTTLAGGRPVLVLDMYEHAYHMDYGAKAASYIDAFMKAIRWDNVAMLHARYSASS
jgi:Fe-Mn family superoxide dismutase